MANEVRHRLRRGRGGFRVDWGQFEVPAPLPSRGRACPGAAIVFDPCRKFSGSPRDPKLPKTTPLSALTVELGILMRCRRPLPPGIPTRQDQCFCSGASCPSDFVDLSASSGKSVASCVAGACLANEPRAALAIFSREMP